MLKNTIYLPLDNFASPSNTIAGINFSRREIDVIACLTNGQATKSIASILNISTRTVEVYIQQVLVKLNFHSRFEICEYFINLNEYPLIAMHYVKLIYNFTFESCLKKIPKLLSLDKKIYLIFDKKIDSSIKSFIGRLEIYFQIAGFNVSSNVFQKDYLLKNSNFNDNDIIIYITSSCKKFNNSDMNFDYKKSKVVEISNVIMLFVDLLPLIHSSVYGNKLDNLNIKNQESHYYSIFEILLALLPANEINHIIHDFTKTIENISKMYALSLLSNTLQESSLFVAKKQENVKWGSDRYSLTSYYNNFLLSNYLIINNKKNNLIPKNLRKSIYDKIVYRSISKLYNLYRNIVLYLVVIIMSFFSIVNIK